MNNLRTTGKVKTQRKGHISLCWRFNACNGKFEANFGKVGLSGRARSGAGAGLLQRYNDVRLRMFYLLDMCTVYHCKVTLKHLWPRVYSVFSETLPYNMLFYTQKKRITNIRLFREKLSKNYARDNPER